jgi:hypothetical protein
MTLKVKTTIEIPGAADSAFDHGAFDSKTRRLFIAHTARDSVDVIDHDRGKHIATLPGFKEAAGVVADNGQVLVTNRGAASLAWLDGETFETRAVFDTAPRPNGAALVESLHLAAVACIGDDSHAPELQTLDLRSRQRWSLKLPGRPRWCVTDAAGALLFLAIREPSMVLVARLPNLTDVQHWPLSSGGAHGMDIDHRRRRLYVACDDGALVELETDSGTVMNQWPLAGVPDATFFNPASSLVHVAIGNPGLVQTVNPQTSARSDITTAHGAHTTALAQPDTLYVFSSLHRGALVLNGA